MALKILPTNNPGYNPFTSDISDTDFVHIIDQGFRNTRVNPQITRVAGDIWYTKGVPLPSGGVVIHITDVGVYAQYDTAVGDDDSDTGEWLYADVIFETAYNNMVDFVMARVRPVA